MVLAHEKWFAYAAAYPTQWSQLFSPADCWPVCGARPDDGARDRVAENWRRPLLPGPEAFGVTLDGRAQMYALVPLILGIHVGVPLIVLGINGQLFSPNHPLSGPWFTGLGVAQIGIGLSVIYGGLARAGGAALCLVGSGTAVVGLESMLENVHYLGFGAFFLLTGRGPYAIDRLLFPMLEPTRRLSRLPCPASGSAQGWVW